MLLGTFKRKQPTIRQRAAHESLREEEGENDGDGGAKKVHSCHVHHMARRCRTYSISPKIQRRKMNGNIDDKGYDDTDDTVHPSTARACEHFARIGSVR